MIQIAAGKVTLEGHMRIPSEARRFVVFVHGSGSSRHSIRNNFVAEQLEDAGIGSLLFDLLTEEEDSRRENRFDIPLLTERTNHVLEWVATQESVPSSGIHLFGASTGAAAAIQSAARPGSGICSVVSRGGRPDMAGEALGLLKAPCLLIVGENDPAVLDMNREAQARMSCENELRVVKGATHLFQEPGALKTVAQYALDWIAHH
ncbi:MAG: dienelactone hydrolase family protein [Spirochaetota bacterium]